MTTYIEFNKLDIKVLKEKVKKIDKEISKLEKRKRIYNIRIKNIKKEIRK